MRALTASMTCLVFTPLRATTTPPTASLRALDERRHAEGVADLHVGDLLDVDRHAARRADRRSASTSSTDAISPTPRTISQAPFDSSTLPPTFRLLSRTAATTALSGRL